MYVCSAAVINWGLLVLVLYALYYTALEPAAGLSWGVLLGAPMWLTATAFQQHVPHAWAWALGLHILSWFLQVQRHSGPIRTVPEPGMLRRPRWLDRSCKILCKSLQVCVTLMVLTVLKRWECL